MKADTLPTLFRERWDQSRDLVALRHKKYGVWTDVTWEEYYTRVKHVCLGLVTLGLKKGQCVAIIGENRPEWVFTDLGVMCVGGTSVGVYSTSSWQQCAYIVKHCEANFFLVENEEQLDKALRFREDTPSLRRIIVWDMKGLRNFSDPMVMRFDDLIQLGREKEGDEPDLFDECLAEINPEDLALIIYTSGTTGPPKGAMLTHRNIVWLSESLRSAVPIREDDEFLSFLPLCHIFERIFTVLANIRWGARVNFIENTDTVAENLKEVSSTIAYGVPRIWEKYYSLIMIRMSDATWFKRRVFGLCLGVGKKYTELKFSGQTIPLYWRVMFEIAHFAVFRKLKKHLGFDRVRVALSGAAPISPDVLRFFHSIGVELLEGYGQTEGTGVTTVNRQKGFRIGTVGQPLRGIEVRIAEDGEILVMGPNVFKGYFKDPEATSEALCDGWLYSGDIGRINEDGYLCITDRKKDLIITAGGKNITPQNIENQLKFSSYINDAVVIGDKRKYITALIVIDEDTVVKYAQDTKIQYTTYEDLTRQQEVIELIQKEVDKVNKTLAKVETVKKFTILPKKLYEEDGEVTPTMKVKRKIMHKKFKDEIEAMYR